MTEPTIHYEDRGVTLWHGDCLDVLRALPDDSVDAVVTDPPYGLEFMGKEWDAPWKSGADVHAEARTRRADEMTDENKRRYIASAVNKFSAGLPFQQWCEQWATECLRVLKPGGHMLAFGGSRTWHRLAVAVEDAGFEIRDSIAWLYGSGFPKSHDVSKAIDKLDASEERTARAREFQSWLRKHLTPQQVNAATGTDMGHHLTTHPTQPAVATADLFDRLRPLLPEVPERIEELVAQRTVESENFKRREVVGTARMVDTSRSRLGFAGTTYGGDGSSRDVALTAAHTEEAAAWQGWGTALKPAFEPIVVARKPLAGTVAANVLAHGTGALNIDGCRVATSDRWEGTGMRSAPGASYAGSVDGSLNVSVSSTHEAGRWPTNVVLDESQAAELDRQSGERPGDSPHRAPRQNTAEAHNRTVSMGKATEDWTTRGHADTGGASRFFPTFRYEAKAPTSERPRVSGTAHPTVKPLDLMRWLVRLVTPSGGVVLEPFAGSGTTAEACVLEGFGCIAIEREEDYLQLIVNRLTRRTAPVEFLRATGADMGLFSELDGGA